MLNWRLIIIINNILRLMAKVSIMLNFTLIIFSLQGDSGQPGVPGEPVCDLWSWSALFRCLNRGWFYFCLSGFAWEGWAAGPEGRQGRVWRYRTERNQGKSLSNGGQHKMNFLSFPSVLLTKTWKQVFCSLRQALFHLHESNHTTAN